MIPNYGTFEAWLPTLVGTGLLCLVLLVLSAMARSVARRMLALDDKWEEERSRRRPVVQASVPGRPKSRTARARQAQIERKAESQLADRTERLTKVDHYRKASGALATAAVVAVALAVFTVGLLLLPPWAGITLLVLLGIVVVLTWRLLVRPGPPSALLRLEEPEVESVDD